jgi:CRP/FNR family transcriptional regulator
MANEYDDIPIYATRFQWDWNMHISSDVLPWTRTLATAGNKRAPTDTRSLVSPGALSKSCSSTDFDGRETLKFGNLVTGKRRVARHATLYRKPDRLSMLYLVRFGQFKLISGDLDEQRVAEFHMAGDLMGLDAIATGKHNFRLTATEDSEVYEIPFTTTDQMMKLEPAIQCHLLQSMSEALNNGYSRSFLLAATSLDVRFAGFLLRLGEKYARLGYSDKSYRLSMSRGDIGSYLGTSVESVSRLVARFNAQGAVSIIGRTVEIRDRPCLLAFMHRERQVL